MSRQRQGKPKGSSNPHSTRPHAFEDDVLERHGAIESNSNPILSMTSLNKFHVRRPAELKRMKPEMVVSKNVVMKADLKFHNLLRVEGTVEGKIIAPPDAGLVLCSSGTFLGDICGLGVVYVDGKVKGNIFVDHLGLGPNAQVHGNVFCKRIEVAGSASIIGQLLVNTNTQIPTSYVERAALPLVEEQSDSDDDDDRSISKSKKNSPQKLQRERRDDQEEDDENAREQFQNEDVDVGAQDLRDSVEGFQGEEDDIVPEPIEPQVVDSPQQKEDKRIRSRRNNKESSESILVIHEPQVDFYPGGNWYTKGVAFDDTIDRLADFIGQNILKIDRIIIIMDIHQNLSPRQSLFWENMDGEHPPVGTVITLEDVMSEKWTPTENISSDEVMSWFTADPSTGDVSTIIIQPKHGQLGGPGAALVPKLHEAVSKWSDVRKDEVQYVLSKVSTSKEDKHNYHALLHEDSYDLSTTFANIPRISKFMLAGQYQSHCRNFTMRNIAEVLIQSQQHHHNVAFNPESIFIITDGICFSPAGFEIPEDSSEYIHELNQQGYSLTTTDELIV